MPDTVKPSRPYDSSRRREQARRTRASVLDAARRTFLAKGYAATTIAAVAAAAEVSVDTIYKQFRGKAGLLKAVYDVAIVGDDEPVPFAEREHVRRWSTDPDAARVIREYCALFALTSARVAPMVLLVHSAGGDPDARLVWDGIRYERLAGMGQFAANLHERGLLRPELGAEAARDIFWVHGAGTLRDAGARPGLVARPVRRLPGRRAHRRAAPRPRTSRIAEGPAVPNGTTGPCAVELRGLEPLTPTLPVWCATSCATAPSCRNSVASPDSGS